eukprot:scaffold12554_cov90-Isochrysis_galbana.AAC.2
MAARPMTGMAMPKAPQTGMRTAMGTAAGGGGGFGSGAIREGKYTEQIYGDRGAQHEAARVPHKPVGRVAAGLLLLPQGRLPERAADVRSADEDVSAECLRVTATDAALDRMLQATRGSPSATAGTPASACERRGRHGALPP